MSSEVKSSHYVSRAVTRAWEANDRRLHFFDLASGKMGCEPSRTLFAVPSLHATETEQRLSQRVEDVVGKYRTRCMKVGGRLDDFSYDTRVARALVALIALQGQRTHEALLPNTVPRTLDEMLADEKALDSIVDSFLARYELVGGSLTVGDWMCFPSSGSFAIPVLGSAPAMAVPITPGAFVTLIERGTELERRAIIRQLKEMVRHETMIRTFSMLGGGVEHKLVVPAQIAEQNDSATIETLITNMRPLGRELFNLHGKMAHAVGLRAFHYDGR